MKKIFSNCKSIIAIHSKLEKIIEENEEIYMANYGEDVPIACNPLIRSAEIILEAQTIHYFLWSSTQKHSY